MIATHRMQHIPSDQPTNGSTMPVEVEMCWCIVQLEFLDVQPYLLLTLCKNMDGALISALNYYKKKDHAANPILASANNSKN